jgi:hypothetical protein
MRAYLVAKLMLTRGLFSNCKPCARELFEFLIFRALCSARILINPARI